MVTTPAIPVDAAFLDAAGPQLRIVANYAVGLDNIDFAAIRERGIVVSNTPGRAHEHDSRARDRARARPPAAHRRGRPFASAPRRLGVGAGLHGRGGARRQGAARRRPGADRSPSRRARGRTRRPPNLRRARRRPAPGPRRGGCRDPALPADARDAASHRRRRPRRDEAHCRARQHRAGAGRRRARARRGSRAESSRRCRTRRVRARACRERRASRDGERRPHAAHRERHPGDAARDGHARRLGAPRRPPRGSGFPRTPCSVSRWRCTARSR